MSKDKKKEQLGIAYGTASSRLRKMLLWDYVQKCSHDTCFQCGEKIASIDDLSIEHKTPWLDSEDPQGLFFDLDNIAFSHLSCNVGAARKELAGCGTAAKYKSGCRCQSCVEYKRLESARYYTPEKRRRAYLKRKNKVTP